MAICAEPELALKYLNRQTRCISQTPLGRRLDASTVGYVGLTIRQSVTLQYPLHGRPQVLENGYLLQAMAGQQAGLVCSPSGPHQRRLETYRHSCLHIAQRVTHQEGTPQVYAQLVCCIEQESRLWLATAASLLRAVRAVNDGVNTSTSLLNDFEQMLMDGFDHSLADQAAVYGRLIADHYYTQVTFAQPSQSLQRARQQHKLTQTLDVIRAVVVKHTVSVQEYGSPCPG